MSNSHNKFGWISSNGSEGDSITDRRTDGGDYNIPFTFLKSVGIMSFSVREILSVFCRTFKKDFHEYHLKLVSIKIVLLI